MTLRGRLVLHLTLVHLALAAVAAVVLWQERRWLPLVEVLFLVSAAASAVAVRAVSVPRSLLDTGAELLAERDFSTRFRQVGDPQLDRLVEVYNAMSERLREDRLRLEEQHHFLDEVLAASPAGILSLDFDGRVAQVNASALALLQVEEGQAAGLPLAAVPSALAAPLAELAVGASRVVAQSGRRRLRVSRGELFDRGFPRSFFVVEELTEELRASERAAYEKLLRQVSHEVNNTTGAVVSLLDSCRDHAAALPAGQRGPFLDALGVAAHRLERLGTFIGAFAEVVRLPPPEPRPTDVEALLDDVMTLLAPELERRRIVWRWEGRGALPLLPVDKNQVEQVLLNVLRNAVEAIGENGEILLELGRDDAGVPRLAIADSGPGLAPEVAAQLFTPFFSTKREGRGLGLTLVQEILDQHRFDFALEGRPGGGATFVIRFGA